MRRGSTGPGNFHSDALHVVERYTPMGRDVIRYEATIEDPQVFTRPWKISMPLYRRLEPNAQLMDFRCVEMVEETMYGHLRKEQLVKRWTGNTMTVDITRTIPPGEAVHERYISGNRPPENEEIGRFSPMRIQDNRWSRHCRYCLCFCRNAPVWAHHAFAAEFDGNKPVQVSKTPP